MSGLIRLRDGGTWRGCLTEAFGRRWGPLDIHTTIACATYALSMGTMRALPEQDAGRGTRADVKVALSSEALDMAL